MRRQTVSSIAAPLSPTDDRRRRSRLRDLCDEVLASFRLADGRDPIPVRDREDAAALHPRRML